MKPFILQFLNGRILSPWWIFAIDIVITMQAFFIAYVLLFSLQLSDVALVDLLNPMLFATTIYGISYIVFGSFKGVIRHTGFRELIIMFYTCLFAGVILTGIHFTQKTLTYNWLAIPKFIILLHFMLTFFLCMTFRLIVREAYAYLTRKRGSINTLIYGAGDLGMITLEALLSNKNNDYHVVGFIDDNPTLWGMKVCNIPVSNWEFALARAEHNHISVLVLAINNISIQHKGQIADVCIKRNWKLQVMPSVNNWVNGLSNQNQIRDVKIEDLLGREEIQLNQKRILNGLEGKVVLVTGAAGSIGSEIVRTILKYPIRKILLLDQAESALYNLQQELLLSYADAPFELIIGDVSSKNRMSHFFKQHQPQIVFHAAAYKHVPLMEHHPNEAVRVNIGGTKIIADLCIEHNVSKFVMISTDKAVNPTNVMGASKRICEIYIQALSQQPNIKTSFITTRFGNVLGSNGSVVPLFKKQIEQGGPVTVTHPEITRFFMTIPEACQLVLEAGFMGKGGEIFLFDMGLPIKIDDLARKMIQLAGLKVGEDILIKYTGLRPGEKLFEELLASKENTLPTHHNKILIGKVREYKWDEVNIQITNLVNNTSSNIPTHTVQFMKQIVPEYISKNSEFEKLDENNTIESDLTSVSLINYE